MQKSNLPQGVKSLMGWVEKGCLTFDNPAQRAGSQWTLLQKSLMIHSMLANYPVPAVYLQKSKDYLCLCLKNQHSRKLFINSGLYGIPYFLL